MQTRPSIRRATQKDVPAIVRIEKDSFGRDAWTTADFLGYFAQLENCVFLVATTGDKVVGYIIGFRREIRAEIDSVAVSPPWRQRGIAEALIRRLKQLTRRRGSESLALAVRLDNTQAIALYRKLGFRRDRRVNNYYEDGAPAWRMKVSLVD